MFKQDKTERHYNEMYHMYTSVPMGIFKLGYFLNGITFFV